MTTQKIGSLLLFFLSFGLCQGQTNDSLTLVSSFSTTADKLYADPLGSFYLVEKSRSIIKYSAAGVLLFRYSNNRLGDLGWMDTTDPFHIQLYFPDYRKLVLLDNDLAEVESYDLLALGLYDHPGIGLSYDNNFWLFDNNTGRIKKINKSGEVLLESDNIFYELKSTPLPGRVVETKKYVLLMDTEQGVLVFDQFGKFIKQIKKVIPHYFQIWQGRIVYYDSGKLHFIGINDGRSLELPIPSTTLTTHATFAGEKLYTLDNGQVNIL